MSANPQCKRRLKKEAQTLLAEPPPFVLARPNESNILDWHFILRGPPDSVYAGGEYHGVLTFPATYPFAPPNIKMLTPSGRFAVNTSICTSMSDFHPGSWNPAWSVSTILTGLLSFMLSEEITTGGIRASAPERRQLASESHGFNNNHPKFKSIFPDYCGELKDLPNMGPPTASQASTLGAPLLETSDVEEASQRARASMSSTGKDKAPARTAIDRGRGRLLMWVLLPLAICWAWSKL